MRSWLIRLGVAALLVVLPFVLSDFRLSLLIEILIFGLLAASLDLLIGYTGLHSLGHATYFGVGGYAAVLVAEHVTSNPLAGLGSAVVAATVVALVTGWLAVRTRGVYFLMLTLAFAQLLFSLAITWEPVTGGFNGMSMLPGELAGLELDDLILYFYVLIVFLLSYAALRMLIRAPFGRTLVGVHENEARMRSVGYSTFAYKLASFTVAGGFGGLAGALFVQFNRFISPTTVAFEISALVLIMVIMGGVGTLYGPVLGAGLVLLLREELSARFEHWELLLGLVFIAFVYLLRGGLGGLLQRTGRRLTRPRGASKGPPSADGPAAGSAAETATEPATEPFVQPATEAATEPDAAPAADPALMADRHTERPDDPSGASSAPADTPPPGPQPAGVRDDHGAAVPLLEVRSARKEYGSLVAVDDVSMTVAAGERRAVIGLNGAGKSTLFNLLGGVTTLTGGTVHLGGRNITRVPEHRRARIGIAKTFQHSNLFEGLSAVENVAIAVRRHQGVGHRALRPATSYRGAQGRALELLAQVGLAHQSATAAGTLSHGERRQIEVAVALAIEPTLLLLDEPVAGMSVAEGREFVAMVGRLPESLTIIVIEHDMDVVFALANRISVLDAGRVLAEGTPHEIREDPLVQEAYLGAGQTEIFQTTT